LAGTAIFIDAVPQQPTLERATLAEILILVRCREVALCSLKIPWGR
jgi:hypothetical protein